MSSTVLTKPDTKKLKLARQIREARKRGEESLKHDPRASFAKYENGRVIVGLTSGWSFSFDPRIYRGLKNASDEELADVSVLGFGFVLEWEKIDQHLGVGSLVLDLLGEKFLNAESARRLGSATTEKKKSASRTNGKLGGRPKKPSLDNG